MTEGSRIRIGVAGLGRIGWSFHCRHLAAHADFELVAAADTAADRRAEAESTFGCTAYSDFDAMLGSAGLDAVVIATPTHLHRDMALAALRAGVHVLLEKPMAGTHAEAAEIVEQAESSGCVLTVYQPHRLDAYFQHLLRLIDSGCIGRVFAVHRGAFRYTRRNDWQSLQRFGGGMLNNYGAHYLDQVLQLIGYDIERVFCDLQLVASLGDAEDVVKVVVETARGVVGELTINQASVIAPFKILVWGEHGAISYVGNELHVHSFDPDALPSKALDPSLCSADRRYPLDRVHVEEHVVPVNSSFAIDVFADFARAVRTGSAPAVPARETLALMAVMQRCRESSAGIDVLK